MNQIEAQKHMLDLMPDEVTRQMLRCTLENHLFDFNEDVGAVQIGKGAACTPCMDRLFDSSIALYPNGERPQRAPLTKQPFRSQQR